MKKLTLALTLISSSALGQTYTQLQWGVNKTVSPYQFGANINGTWSNLGTVSSTGVWQIPASNISGVPTLAGNNVWTGINTFNNLRSGYSQLVGTQLKTANDYAQNLSNPGPFIGPQGHANWGVYQTNAAWNPNEFQVYSGGYNKGFATATAGTDTITITAGDSFDSAWVNLPFFYFNGSRYKISAVDSPTIAHVVSIDGAPVSFGAGLTNKSFYFNVTTVNATVNVSGTSITWVSGQKFIPFGPGYVKIGANIYQYASSTDTTITLSSSAGTSTNTAITQYMNINDQVATLRAQTIYGSNEENLSIIARATDRDEIRSFYAGLGQYRPIIIGTGESANGSITVTGGSWAANYATVTFTGTYKPVVGDIIKITGASPSGYNTSVNGAIVTSVGAGSFTYYLVNDPGSSLASATVTLFGGQRLYNNLYARENGEVHLSGQPPQSSGAPGSSVLVVGQSDLAVASNYIYMGKAISGLPPSLSARSYTGETDKDIGIDTLGLGCAVFTSGTFSYTEAKICAGQGTNYPIIQSGASTSLAYTGPKITTSGSSDLVLAPTGDVKTTKNVIVGGDNNSLRFRPTSVTNLNGWRLGSTLNGSSDGYFYLQHSTDNYVANFYTSMKCDTNGYCGFGDFGPSDTPAYPVDVKGGVGAASANLKGSSSGIISILPQAAAGTYNFNLPTTAGTSSYLLTSAGGGAAAMTWTSPTTTVNGTSCTLGSTCTVTAASASIPFPQTVSGTVTSGGIPYFNSTTQMSSSALLAQYQLIVGGGAGAAPATLGATGSAGQHLQSGGASANPSWTTATFPSTTAAGTVLTSASANTVTASSTPTLGISGTSNGNLTLASSGGASGAITLAPASSTSAYTATFPANTGDVAELNLAQSWSAKQTITTSGTGLEVVNSSATGPNLKVTGAATQTGNMFAISNANTAQNTGAEFVLAGPQSTQGQTRISHANSDAVSTAARYATALYNSSGSYQYITSQYAYNAGTWIFYTNGGNTALTLDAAYNAIVTNSVNVSAALPTISSCGTSPPAATAGSSNNAGQFTLGTGTPTACTITFNTTNVPYANYAYCTVTPASNYTGTYYISAQSKTAFTVTLGTGTASVKFNYTCFGN